MRLAIVEIASMAARRIAVAALVLACVGMVAQEPAARTLPRFEGRAVTVIVPETDADGFYPKGPASICVEAPPERQCYTAPKDFGRNPTVAVIELKKGEPALFFSAASGGVSGYTIHFALLRPAGKGLENLFVSDTSVSAQSQNAFWTDASVSDATFLVTADYIWGPDESHFSRHRFIISSYVQRHSLDLEGDYYFLQDRYMTVRSYDLKPGTDILGLEKPETLARLRRIKSTEAQRRRAQ
jgi:hypothetical protein